MPREITEVHVDHDGTETHESWVRMGVNRVSASPGQALFDSEIVHQHYVVVTVYRCERRRDLNRDWLYSSKTIAEFGMSMSQWGAFVSSFGEGGGVPATMFYFGGEQIPGAPHSPRLGESVREVREAGDKALERVQEAQAALQEAFDRNAGKKEMRELMRSLQLAVEHAPGNMAFAAESLVKHTENVVTKAKADIEAMVLAARDRGEFTLESGETNLLGSGEA